ncbi:MAG: hypothetical protein JXI32_03440 [Deltaproteobacteria bacterium]|nr:hypothetical protein [Deltaproteobacteria bacterium]
MEATVVEGSRLGKALISLKNSTIVADSKVPLAKGETIAVRVTQLHPGVVLRVLHGGMAERAGLSDHLGLYRARPEALSDLLVEGTARFSAEQLGELAAHLGKKEVELLQDLFRSLIFSRESLKNPLFFREYVHTLGYLMEHTLGEALKRRLGRADHLRDASQSLKGLLTRVLDRLQSLPEIRNHLPAAERLAGFVRSSLQVIDSHQVINYLFQEHDGAYMFQVPLLFPEKRGTAEIFVKFGGRDSRGGDRRGMRTVLFLLNMDALGEIVAEAKIEAKKVGCILRCGDAKSCDFMRPFLGELGEGLAALGYDIEYLHCVVNQKDTAETRGAVYREFQRLFAPEGVDVLV